MNIIEHFRLRRYLYDNVVDQDSLNPEIRKRIHDHLSSCRRCHKELQSLALIARMTKENMPSPSDQRSAEYWSTFADAVEERLRPGERERRNIPSALNDLFRDLPVFRRRSAALLATGLAIGIVAGMIVLRHEPTPGVVDDVAEAVPQPAATPQIELARMQKYFRKSKTLLIGIENMKLDEREGLDLSGERDASRELLQEARYLQYQPLDNRSARLIQDLERILIELANMKEQEGLLNVEIVRGGIHQENLLFKIRQAESMYDSARFIAVDNKN